MLTQWTRSDYAVNAGDVQVDSACEPQTDNPWHFPSSFSQGDDPTYQWYTNGKNCTGVAYQVSRVKMADITDGTSNTYLVGEKYLNPDLYETGSDPGDNEGVYMGFANNVSRFTQQLPLQDTPGVGNWCIFGSAHANGFQMAFCDGSVQMMNYSIGLAVHQCLGNRADGHAIDAKSF